MVKHLLLGRVGVVKPNDKLSLISLSEVVVQKGSFRMSNVKIATGLGRESRDNFAHFSTLELNVERSLVLLHRLEAPQVVSDMCRTSPTLL